MLYPTKECLSNPHRRVAGSIYVTISENKLIYALFVTIALLRGSIIIYCVVVGAQVKNQVLPSLGEMTTPDYIFTD